MDKSKIETMQEVLFHTWSEQSSTLYTPNNPARGNCGVTALVVQDHLGGEILKTRWGDIWHFYNKIDGQVIDFTSSQFDSPIAYDNLPSSRSEAFGDTNEDQYDYLSSAVETELD